MGAVLVYVSAALKMRQRETRLTRIEGWSGC
jgi:hypothetical protein